MHCDGVWEWQHLVIQGLFEGCQDLVAIDGRDAQALHHARQPVCRTTSALPPRFDVANLMVHCKRSSTSHLRDHITTHPHAMTTRQPSHLLRAEAKAC